MLRITTTFPKPSSGPLQIHYQDEHMIIVEKITWLLSVPGKESEITGSVVQRVEEAIHKTVFVVHRLDCATSGLMILALDKETQSQLNKKFREREIQKEYQAWVVGTPTKSNGTINEPLARKSTQPPMHMIDYEKGKASTTHWEIITKAPMDSFCKKNSSNETCSLLRLIPITGRSHQLRVHLAWLGHPIIGDRLYSKDREFARTLPRMYLHASALQFMHPITQVALSFQSAGLLQKDNPFTNLNTVHS